MISSLFASPSPTSPYLLTPPQLSTVVDSRRRRRTHSGRTNNGTAGEKWQGPPAGCIVVTEGQITALRRNVNVAHQRRTRVLKKQLIANRKVIQKLQSKLGDVNEKLIEYQVREASGFGGGGGGSGGGGAAMTIDEEGLNGRVNKTRHLENLRRDGIKRSLMAGLVESANAFTRGDITTFDSEDDYGTGRCTRFCRNANVWYVHPRLPFVFFFLFFCSDGSFSFSFLTCPHETKFAESIIVAVCRYHNKTDLFCGQDRGPPPVDPRPALYRGPLWAKRGIVFPVYALRNLLLFLAVALQHRHVRVARHRAYTERHRFDQRELDHETARETHPRRVPGSDADRDRSRVWQCDGHPGRRVRV